MGTCRHGVELHLIVSVMSQGFNLGDSLCLFTFLFKNAEYSRIVSVDKLLVHSCCCWQHVDVVSYLSPLAQHASNRLVEMP